MCVVKDVANSSLPLDILIPYTSDSSKSYLVAGTYCKTIITVDYPDSIVCQVD